MFKIEKFRNGLRITVIVVALAMIVYSSYNLYSSWNEERLAHKENEDLITLVEQESETGETIVNEVSFEKLHQMNQDFIGWLSFDSKLIEEPVVYSGDNTYYLTHNFTKKRQSMGTVFLDEKASLKSMNMTLYGHFVYRDESLKFSPLHKLKSKANYNEHKIFRFSTKDEVRVYQVAHVFLIDETEFVADYYLSSYTEQQFSDYMSYIKKNEFYNTGITIDRQDTLMTFQTCVRNQEDQRLIVVGKLIEIIPNQG